MTCHIIYSNLCYDSCLCYCAGNDSDGAGEKRRFEEIFNQIETNVSFAMCMYVCV